MTPPDWACPKCAADYGFLHSRPRYDADPDIGERLIWECSNCGYVVVTETATPEDLTVPPAFVEGPYSSGMGHSEMHECPPWHKPDNHRRSFWDALRGR